MCLAKTQDLLTAAPRVTVGGQTYQGTYDEDIGSTMVFDRASLKRMANAQSREARELTPQDAAEEERPLMCVTTKRLRLQTHGTQSS